MKDISVIIAARMGSSRFKGKTLSNLHGKPLLYRLIERVKYSQYIDDIILATTNNPEDDLLEDFCFKNSISCYRGSADDVLLRLKEAAVKSGKKNILEILGDNPLIHSEIIDTCINKYFSCEAEYLATSTKEYPYLINKHKLFPIGIRVQVFSLKTLLKCESLAKEKKYREHATMFIAENPKIFNSIFLEAKGNFEKYNRPNLTFAVNYKENLKLINYIYSKNYIINKNFSILDAINTFDKNQKLKNLMYPLN